MTIAKKLFSMDKRCLLHYKCLKFELLRELQKFQIESYCVGGRHRSATTNVYGEKSSKSGKVLIGYCSICNRKKDY